MKLPHIDWARTVAGALAAVAAAILLSKLGAAGTLIGAAIGSLVISIGTNVGAHGIDTARERMLEAQREAARRVSEAQAELRRARSQTSGSAGESQQRLAAAEDALESAQSELAKDVPTSDVPVIHEPILDEADAAHDPGMMQPTQVLPAVSPVVEVPKRRVYWKRAAIFAAASFVIALVLITAFELIEGRPLSSFTGGGNPGGTSISDNFGSGSKPKPKAPVSPSSPTASTSTSTPTGSPTPSLTPSPTASTSPTSGSSPTSPASPTTSGTPVGVGTPSGVPTTGATP